MNILDLTLFDTQGIRYRIVRYIDEVKAEPLDLSNNETSVTHNFGDVLRYKRKQLKLTQMDIFRMSGVKQPNICAIEKKRRLPEPETRQKLIDCMVNFANKPWDEI